MSFNPRLTGYGLEVVTLQSRDISLRDAKQLVTHLSLKHLFVFIEVLNCQSKDSSSLKFQCIKKTYGDKIGLNRFKARSGEQNLISSVVINYLLMDRC